MLRRSALAIVFLCTVASATHAQSLRDRFIELFTFGDCGSALCLGGVSELIGHGNHFITAAEEGGATALTFITNAIASNVANVPIPSTSGGSTFEFIDGLPVRTDLSAGPIFAERVETLGQGRLLIGTNATYIDLQSVRGVPMDNLLFNFGHEDIDPDGLGSPGFENDLIQVRTNLAVNLFVATGFMTFGLLDAVDVGIAVPFVRVSVGGNSVANILPVGGTPSPHQFSGTAENPVLVAVAGTDASASGLGDVAGRLKIRLVHSDNWGIGLLGEARFPTGNEEDLLGAGELAGRVLAIVSAKWGDFTPHINAGYTFRQAEFQNDAISATVGFDQLLAPWATLAVDLVTEWQVGASVLAPSNDIVYESPFARAVPSTLIPNRRDDLLDGSVGFKLTPTESFTLILNALVPMADGGVQPAAAFTAGFQVSF